LASPNNTPALPKPVQKAQRNSGVSDGNFTIAYSYDKYEIELNEMWDCVEYGIVDPLISPLETGGSGTQVQYISDFNAYTCSEDENGDPGLILTPSGVPPLIANLTKTATQNFFFVGHGSVTDIGDQGNVDISKNLIGGALGNGYSLESKTIQRNHAYRFVFLYACHTADLPEWSEAFGVRDSITAAQANKGLAQAFVGWRNCPRAPVSDDDWYNFSIALEQFNSAWMKMKTLKECMAIAQSPSLAWPFNNEFTDKVHKNNFVLKYYGYPLLKRTGYDTQ
jgi:hypothetical protein